MANLAEQVATALAGTSRARDLRVGLAVEDADNEGEWLLNVGGAELEAWWPEDYYPSDGDTVIAAMVGETWHVVAPIQRDPAPVPPIMGRVKTVPTGSSRITVTVGGVDMELAFLNSYTPVVGHDVALLWQPGYEDALVLGRRGSTPRPKPKPVEPKPKPSNPKPPKKTTGRTTFNATRTATWDVSAGGWSGYQGANVVTGTWSGRTSEGYWFYGTKPRNALKGATVKKAEIYLPNRLRMGMYNNTASTALQRHTSNSRPSGRPSKSGSTTSVSVPKIGTTKGWTTIPNSLAQTIINNGGGIALVGSTYLGFPGAGSGSGRNPRSGALRISWEK